MDLNAQLIKALRLADLGQFDRAIKVLQQLLDKIGKEPPSQDILSRYLYVQVHCVLGELYFELEQSEKAKIHLITVINTPCDDDLAHEELATAQDLLQKIEANSVE